MREFAGFASTVPGRPENADSDPTEGREQLMTDLGDFSEGEQAARRNVRRRTADGGGAKGSHE
jgi:hypothetical protein